MPIWLKRKVIVGCFCWLAPMVVLVGCAKHPQQIQASPEQQQKWADEEAAASQKKLDEARARGDIR